MLRWIILVALTSSAAAQSVGGSSGISAISVASAPVAPAPAAGVGFTTSKFYDASFTSIDRTNSLLPGFNWYVNNQFPNAFANGTAWAPITTSIPTPSADLIVTGNILEISDSANNFTQGINTCYWNGSAVAGTTFSGGFYVEVSMAYDVSLSPAGQSGAAWPIYWFTPEEFLNGSITNTNFAELDGYEAGPTATPGVIQTNMAFHYWNTSNGLNTVNSNYTVSIAGNLLNQHAYGTLYATAASNGGLGLIKRYFDGTLIKSATVNFSASAVPNPSATPNNASGTFSQIDSEHHCLMLGAGHSWPNYIAKVQVWGGTFVWAPSGPTITAPTASTVTDSAGNVWGFGSATSGGNYQVIKNGSQAYGTGAGASLVIYEGVAVVENAAGAWYQDNGSVFVEVSP